MRTHLPLRRHAWTRTPAGGFTLVELLVALTLAAIISMTIMIISNTAREIYEETTKKVELSNRFRLALLTLDRDFSQWVNTSNLEFFADGRGGGARVNQQWDEGEELRDETDELGKGVVDGGIYNKYEEFASITERHYIGIDPEEDPNDPASIKIHDAYQAYLRAVTYIDGKVREANVEYMLLDPNNPDVRGNPRPPVRIEGEKLADLVLVKVVRYHDIRPEQLFQVAENFPIVRRRVEIASNITDFRLEYFVENPFNPRVTGGFRTPAQEYDSAVERAARPKPIASPRTRPDDPKFRQFQKTFGYGSNYIQARFPRATAFKARQGDRQQKGDHQPTRFGFLNSNELQFAELTQGDEIFIFRSGDRGGQGGPEGVSAARTVSFPANVYTVKSNVSGILQFYEFVDSSTWRGDQAPILYKAGYLPSSVRVTLRVVDEQAKNPKTMQREIWIRRKAR